MPAKPDGRMVCAMKTRVSRAGALERVRRSCQGATDGHDLFERLSADFHELVPHDGAVWFGADPATLLVTSPVRVEAMEESHCDPYWHHEFHIHDTAQFVDLARSPVPAAALQLSLDGRPARSARYRALLRPDGYEDELRAVLRTGENTWGMVGLYREKGRSSFDADDVAFVSRASAIIGGALRHHVRAHSPWLGVAQAPGLIMFDARSTVVSANAEAVAWLRQLVSEDRAGSVASGRTAVEAVWDLLASDELDRQVSPIWALLARARALASGIDDRAARLRLRDRRGQWLVLHGSALTGSGEGNDHVAIVIEPAKSSEIAPIIIDAYSLTRREREVVSALARGDSTSEIATRLFLSQHTVRDHIKTVFEKVGISSRAELVAKLFAEHYNAPAHTDMVSRD
jgi:DNA-binding CsgD family transcriptional regulator